MKERTTVVFLVLGALLVTLGAGAAVLSALPNVHDAARGSGGVLIFLTGVALVIYTGMSGPVPDDAGAAGVFPVAVDAVLDEPLSRWLWLAKWILAAPHMAILFFLWIASFILTVTAFVAIVVTGRYPHPLFATNVGIMRWSWRVGFYAYSVLGTDRYPPFTLADVDYPAQLRVAYPAHSSRGLALVKWWLLAIPHYLIVGIFTNTTWSSDSRSGSGGPHSNFGLARSSCSLVRSRCSSPAVIRAASSIS